MSSGGGNLPRTIRVRVAGIRVADPMVIEQLDAIVESWPFPFPFDLLKNNHCSFKWGGQQNARSRKEEERCHQTRYRS
jgi:hypothetical protein